jgi:hypothetical protein
MGLTFLFLFFSGKRGLFMALGLFQEIQTVNRLLSRSLEPERIRIRKEQRMFGSGRLFN